MKVKIIAGANTYLIAGVSHAAADGNYQGRLLNELKLKNAFSSSGNSPLTLNISIRNNDAYIAATVNLWAVVITVTADGGQSWSGKITAYDSDGDGVMYIVATEKSAPELTIQIPDEVAHLVTVDDKFHTSAVNMTLPLVIGGTAAAPHLIKGILIDKTAGIYLLCVGEIHQVVKIYSGTKELTTGFTAYTGTAGQATFPGFAYVQITDTALQKNDDGSYAEISADIIGLKLGTSTIEECRNGARFLYWLLKTAKDGVCGWGLGIADADIDVTVFNTAIAAVATAGLKLDGIFYYRQSAQSWIDQICQAIRGSYSIGQDGKRKLYVNVNAASAKTYTAQNIKLLRYGKGAYTGRVYNKGRLEYGYNPITGIFMQSAQYEDDTGSIDNIDEQPFLGQSYLIKDAATAQAIIEYTCKRSLIAAEKAYFETMELPAGCRIGTVITIAYPEKNLSGDWQITDLESGDFTHTIEAVKFNSSIFTVGTAGTNINWTVDAPVISSITPGAPSGLSLSSEVRPSPDGTNIIVINGTFTLPAGAYMAANIDYGEGLTPTTWLGLGQLRGNSFEIAPVKPAQAYAVRVQMISSSAHSDYITATLTTQGDSVPPGKASLTAKSFLRHVTLDLLLSSAPSDMGGFWIYKGLTADSAAATKFSGISNKEGLATYSYQEDAAYGSQFYYFIRAVDTWGNAGAFSDAAGPVTIGALLSSDISEALLKIPLGSTMRLSVTNCTDASIAEVNGVKDISGNANHGQAFGGVAVVDTVLGKGLSFDGINDYIALNNPDFADWTIMGSFMRTETTGSWGTLIGRSATGTFSLEIETLSGTSPVFAVYPLNLTKAYALNVLHTYAVTRTPTSIKLYFNGEFVSEAVGANVRTITGKLNFGRWNAAQFFKGTAMPPVIFARALTATEVKSGHMFPQEAIFGQITADLIGVTAIHAKHLAVDEALIAYAAQIGNLVVTNAHIKDLNGEKITVGSIAITGLKTELQTTITTAASTASAAATAASDAQDSADAANNLLADIAADNKLTAVEKQGVRQEWDILAAEKAGLNTQATTFGITTQNTTYNTAFQTLATYLNAAVVWTSGIPSWIADANLGTTTAIVGATFRSTWKAYYDARTALLNAISAKAKTLADAAQSAASAAQGTANTAVTNAATAQTTANTAVTNAATANSLLADIAADNKLTAVEKQDTRQEWDIIAAEKAGLNTQATTFGITTQNTTYNTNFQTLATYLNAGTTWASGIPSWLADANLGTTTTIVGATFRSTWKAYYDARTALLNAIAAKAKTLADDAQADATAAQGTANAAVTNAATAQTTANTAVTNAAAANGLLADIAADNKLTSVEKKPARQEWDIIAAEKSVNNAQANTFGITTQNTTYNTAFQALATYLNAGTAWASGIPSWLADANLATTTTIVGATFRSTWKAYYDARTAMLTAISAKAKTLADDAQATAITKITAGDAANDINTNTTTIDGGKITTSSVTAEKLLIGRVGSALNDDPDFEDATAWSLAYGTIETSTTGKLGSKVFRTRANAYGAARSAKHIPIDPTKTYRRKICARGVNGIGGGTYIYDTYYDANKTMLGSHSFLVGSPPNGVWTDYEWVMQYPATAKYVRVKVDANNGTPGATVFVEIQDNRLEEVIPGTLILNGAITTEKLTSEQITGKDIRTAPNVGSGTSGVKFTSAGIEAWKGVTRTVSITNDGDIAIAGDLSGSTGTFGGQLKAGVVTLVPTGGSLNYGVYGISGYTGYFSIYVAPLGTLSVGVSSPVYVKIRIGDLVLEISGSIFQRYGANAWNSDVAVRVLAGDPVAARGTVRFKTSTSGTTGFFIVIGANNNWNAGQAAILETVLAVGTLTLADAAGTVNYTEYSTKAQGVVVAWVLFNGVGTVAITGSGNVSSISDNGVGDYTINMDTALAASTYAVVFGVQAYTTATITVPLGIAAGSGAPGAILTKTASALRIHSGNVGAAVLYDNNNISVALIL